MKRLLAIVLIVQLAAPGCAPTIHSESPEDAVQIKVECTPDFSTRNAVMLVLRRGLARDVGTDLWGSYAEIHASYYKIDNTPDRIADIARDVYNLPGVQHVDVLDKASVIREIR